MRINLVTPTNSHPRKALTNHENTPGVLVRATKPLPAGRQALRLRLDGYVPAHRSACVSARRRELLKVKIVTQSCPEPDEVFILQRMKESR